jgi:PII-like signaling protein
MINWKTFKNAGKDMQRGIMCFGDEKTLSPEQVKQFNDNLKVIARVAKANANIAKIAQANPECKKQPMKGYFAKK